MKCKDAECEAGEEICCLECDRSGECTDKWKCDMVVPRPECHRF